MEELPCRLPPMLPIVCIATGVAAPNLNWSCGTEQNRYFGSQQIGLRPLFNQSHARGTRAARWIGLPECLQILTIRRELSPPSQNPKRLGLGPPEATQPPSTMATNILRQICGRKTVPKRFHSARISRTIPVFRHVFRGSAHISSTQWSLALGAQQRT